MSPSLTLRRVVTAAAFTTFASIAFAHLQSSSNDAEPTFAETFDAHWEILRDDYPYFELYGVDWDAERAEHRPRAIAAANDTEFAWELARLISALPDPHVSFIPAIKTIKDKWSYPELKTREVERRQFVESWPEEMGIKAPEAFANRTHVYPEIIEIHGEPAVGVVQILAAGPLGSSFDIRLRWPDDTETVHALQRPDKSNLPPPSTHYGENWLIRGRVGSIGYLGIRTFDPKVATLGPDGKMTTMLRAALAELDDTDGIILDFQSNGGGVVAASDPFLGNLLKKTRRYKWGNSGGQSRTIRARKPRYDGELVAIVDERSASGGEWAAKILRDAERAVVVGGRTSGAEAAVNTSNGPDGSVVNFSAWPMAEPGVRSFQEVGIEVDHFLPLTLKAVREVGYESALAEVRSKRFAKALALLGAPAEDLEAIMVFGDRLAQKPKKIER